LEDRGSGKIEDDLINEWTEVCPVVWLYLALEAQIPDKLLPTH